MQLTLDESQVLAAVADYVDLRGCVWGIVTPEKIRFIVNHDGVVEGARIELAAQKPAVASLLKPDQRQ